MSLDHSDVPGWPAKPGLVTKCAPERYEHFPLRSEPKLLELKAQKTTPKICRRSRCRNEGVHVEGKACRF